MNFGLKCKVFNLTTTPTVSPASPIASVLEPGARIVGVTVDPGVSGLGSASFVLYLNLSVLNLPMAQGSATTAGLVRQWWAGVNGNVHTEAIVSAGPAANTIIGSLPMGMPNKITEGFSGLAYDLTLQIATAVDGQCFVFYTVDPPNCYGETA